MAVVVSMTSFHGRGFFRPVQSPGDKVAILAASEAFFGLLLEIDLIATFTQRFFALSNQRDGEPCDILLGVRARPEGSTWTPQSFGRGQAVRQWTLDPRSQVRILAPEPARYFMIRPIASQEDQR